ncbi:transposase, partial [Burkholderia cenocepacia]|uniref:transposase n=2 Tax=Burkholderia cenocepacia TaxID=95486 RepID=UPI001B9302A0
MNEQRGGLQSRLVVDRKRDGRRKYDEDAKRELIQACLKPGVSIARTAMEHDVNPNLVRTWISKYQREQAAGEIVSSVTEPSREARVELPAASVHEESAFMQVVTSAVAPTPTKLAAAFSLNVHLPNGVSLETVSKRPRGAVNFRGELLTSGIGTTETEEMAKPIIDDELWT